MPAPVIAVRLRTVRQRIRVYQDRFEHYPRCAEYYGVVDALKTMGIDVKLMGEPLSEYLKEGRKVITF